MKHTKRCRGGIAIRTRFLADARKYLTWRECRSCGTWLPLGPSDEAPVAVEVRAVRLAQEDGWQEASAFEVYGWNDRLDEVIVESEGGTWSADPRVEVVDDWHAGYLAHAIASHDEEHDLAEAIEEFQRSTVPTPGELLLESDVEERAR